jgi:hypothetical protein
VTHTPSHIIITAANTPITTNCKWKVWHAVIVLCALAWAAGKWL